MENDKNQLIELFEKEREEINLLLKEQWLPAKVYISLGKLILLNEMITKYITSSTESEAKPEEPNESESEVESLSQKKLSHNPKNDSSDKKKTNSSKSKGNYAKIREYLSLCDGKWAKIDEIAEQTNVNPNNAYIWLMKMINVHEVEREKIKDSKHGEYQYRLSNLSPKRMAHNDPNMFDNK